MQVEVDLVTGKTEFIRSDIIYDCGKSLNPAIDLGQVISLVLVRILDVHLMFYHRLVNWRFCLFTLRRLKLLPVVKQLCGLESVEKYLEWKTYP